MKMVLAFRKDVGLNVSFLISRVTGSPYHVAVLFDDDCVEAVAGVGVRRISRAARLAAGDWMLVEVPASPIDVEAAYRYALSQVGAKYDYIGVIWAWWFGRQAGNGVSARWFCSEFAAALLMKARVNLHRQRFAYFTPRRLFNVVTPWS